MKIIQEFKEFALKGNVMDLAVGVIIGAAFGKIVSSLVADVVMPPIGLLVGGISFTSLKFILKPAGLDAAGKAVEAVTLNYGNFLQSSFDFLIVAFAVFAMVKGVNSLRKAPQPVDEAPIQTTETLLAEIRDILKQRP